MSEKLHVSVLHGDLTHTNHPVLMGHYQGDTIAGAERIVDHMVDGALSRRYSLGRYPGKSGTVAVVLAKSDDVQASFRIQHGAIVIGLGKWGELTPTALTQAVQQGVTEYCVQFFQCDGATEVSRLSTGLTINSLLIGSNTSTNIAVEDSVNALVRGVVLANRALQDHHTTLPRIGHIQFAELYLDIAIDAAKAAHRVVKRIQRELQSEISVEPWLNKGVGGQTRLVPSSAHGYWRRWTVTAVQEAVAPSICELPPVLKDRLRASLHEETSADPKMMQVLLDLALRDDVSQRRQPHKLRFLALSDRARAEAMLQETQSEVIGQLIRGSIASTAYKADIARTLFRLLIPLDLKDRLLNQDNIVLVLDEVTANYPWELMIDMDQPLCSRMGMVRQLETVDYEERIRDTVSTNAFIVGDPLTPPNYPELPGARKEAELVASLLKPHYNVNRSSERLGAIEVLNQLLAQPYRIIHIAGHGYYNQAETETAGAKAGVVLDNGLFVTAAEIAQLDPIPELVFLNCCYLGQIDRALPNGLATNRLAASISRELIRRGVRAVVAAGWPVRDDAALCFAQEFYKHLLDARPFGRALKNARQQTWLRFPESNTWGAYQAYGDPDFQLRPKRDGALSDEEDVTVAAEEVLIELTKLSRKKEKSDSEKMRIRLTELEGKCAAEWLKRGDIQEKFGIAYGEHRWFDEASTHYGLAAMSEDAENASSLRAIEQWINLDVRCEDKHKAKSRIEAAITRCDHLLALGETAERWSILGSAYKKLAQFHANSEAQGASKEMVAALAKAADSYHRAAKKLEQEPLSDPYPIVNWVMIEAIRNNTRVSYESWLSKAGLLAQRRFQEKRDVWAMFAVADIALTRACLDKTVKEERNNLVETYRKVFAESGASERERDSALSQMTFVCTILKKHPSSRDQLTISTVESLEYIRAQLQPQKKVEESAGDTTVQSAASPPSLQTPIKQKLAKKFRRAKVSRRPKQSRMG